MHVEGSPGPIKLNIRIIADELNDLGWDISANAAADPNTFLNYTIFDGQTKFDHELVYFIPNGKAGAFPVHKYAFVSCEKVAGDAPHVCVSGKTELQTINELNNIFQKYRKFEQELNEVLINGGSLTELCQVATRFLNNPLYIHDNMFCILALPQYVAGMREFDVDKNTGKTYIPLWLINDFKFDEEYQKTLTMHSAQFWSNEQYPRDYRCLYVNIWDGTYYMGRLLIEEIWSPIKPGQLSIAEYFALYGRAVMLRDININETDLAAYEKLFMNILAGNTVDQGLLTRLLGVMKWDDQDSFICVKTISQDKSLAVKSDKSLRSKYADLIKSFFCFYYDDQSCLIINLTKSGLMSSDPERLLAPVIRESYMYAGISNPFRDLRLIPQAFKQTDYVLGEIRNNPGKWMDTFNHCVLSYMIKGVKQDLSLNMIIDPELIDLIEYDKKNNSFLYETLKTYLENERDITRTAELLSVHRTTIIYRLGRIEKYFKMDLSDINNRLYLLICFKMIEQSGKGL